MTLSMMYYAFNIANSLVLGGALLTCSLEDRLPKIPATPTGKHILPVKIQNYVDPGWINPDYELGGFTLHTVKTIAIEIGARPYSIKG